MKDIALDELKRLIATAQSEKAIQDLLDISKYRRSEYNIDNQTSREILLLSSRFKQISSKYRQGTISETDFNLEVNKINAALIQIIEKVEKRILSLETNDKKMRKVVLGLVTLVVILLIVISGIFLLGFNLRDENDESEIELSVKGTEDLNIDTKKIEFDTKKESEIKDQNYVIDNSAEIERIKLESKAKETELQNRLEAAEREREVAETRAKNIELQAKLDALQREKKAEEMRTKKDEVQISSRSFEKQSLSLESGVAIFLNNYRNYKMFLGNKYGYGQVTSASYSDSSKKLVIKYSYKNGTAVGNIDEDGYYKGKYSTDSSSGDFNMQFESDGTSIGRWNGPFGLGGGDFSLRKR